MNKTKNNNNFILISLGALAIIVFVASMLNLNAAKGKKALTENNEIIITIGEEQTDKITSEDISKTAAQTFTATRKSSGKDPEEVSFTGAPLGDILASKNISLAKDQSVAMGSLDGYTVTFQASEVLDTENLWLVWEEDAKPLEKSSAPYMIVVRKDPFSQRWSKQLCEIKIS